MQVKFISDRKNVKESTKTGVIKARIRKDNYNIKLSNGNQSNLEYQDLTNILKKDGKEDVEHWRFEEVKDN